MLRYKVTYRAAKTTDDLTSVVDPDPEDPYGMFLSLPDSDPDPLVRDTDLDSFIINQK
jgi:hypothetical protein